MSSSWNVTKSRLQENLIKGHMRIIPYDTLLTSAVHHDDTLHLITLYEDDILSLFIDHSIFYEEIGGFLGNSY
jgi:hypothetical protein